MSQFGNQAFDCSQTRFVSQLRRVAVLQPDSDLQHPRFSKDSIDRSVQPSDILGPGKTDGRAVSVNGNDTREGACGGWERRPLVSVGDLHSFPLSPQGGTVNAQFFRSLFDFPGVFPERFKNQLLLKFVHCIWSGRPFPETRSPR